MEEETSVSVGDTTEVSQPEANESEAVSSTEESSEGTENTDTSSERPVSRASERIRQLIAERNAEASKRRELESRLSEGQTAGVSADGIDPEVFAKTVVQRATEEARTSANFAMELERAKDVLPALKTDEVTQEFVSSLINQGFAPLKAVEVYQEHLKKVQEDIVNESKRRASAEQASREGTQVAGAGRGKATDGFSPEDIASMSNAEYEKNRTKILAQYGVRS